MRNRHSLESIEETRGNTATHPPNYFINGQQRQRTANSANLNYPPTYRLHSLQLDQQRSLPYGGYNTSDFSLLHMYSYRVNIDTLVIIVNIFFCAAVEVEYMHYS